MILAMRDLYFVGDSRERLIEFPKPVKIQVGQALREAQKEGKARSAKPLTSIDSGVFEIVSDYDGEAYRAAYVVKLKKMCICSMPFKKNSKQGIKIPKQDLDLIRQRLKKAKEMDAKL